MDWLPDHKAGLHLEHNAHLNVYESIEDYYEDYADDWVSEEEKQKAIAENSVWVLQWYPNTPVGFHAILASSLKALQTHLSTKYPI